MARALIVGCGCRGRSLGAALIADGWLVRGTSRTQAGARLIGAAGIEPALADPDRAGSVLDLVGDATVVVWALGSARGPGALLDALHGARLERVLEHLVDTPVRGFVYEATGTAGQARLLEGERIVAEASGRWRIPARILREPAADPDRWAEAARAATLGVVGTG